MISMTAIFERRNKLLPRSGDCFLEHIGALPIKLRALVENPEPLSRIVRDVNGGEHVKEILVAEESAEFFKSSSMMDAGSGNLIQADTKSLVQELICLID